MEILFVWKFFGISEKLCENSTSLNLRFWMEITFFNKVVINWKENINFSKNTE